MSREWSRETWVVKRGSPMGVAKGGSQNVGCDWESRKVGRKTWVANGSCEKTQGVCNSDPEGSN